MKKAVVMPMVLIITLLMSLLIGAYLKYSSTRISDEYYKNLAEIRGYWGVYGAKELNITSGQYQYNHYNIEVKKVTGTTSWEWNLTIPSGKNSGINNSDLYTKKIVVDSNDLNKTRLYSSK